MVARPNEPERTLTTRLRAIFAWWRAALDAFFRRALRFIRTSSPLAAGLTALTIGVMASGTLTTSVSGGAAGVRAGSTLLIWAGIRLLVLRLTARNTYQTRSGTLVTAWSWSLLPFVMAATDVLHTLAFALSAIVAWRALERLGVARREAVVLVAWSWGFQIATMLAIWLARNTLLAGRIILG